MRNNQIPQINPAQLLAQYQNPGEALKGIGKSLGAQADSMETQRLREIELARQNRDEQRIIDDRALVAEEKLKVDTQDKLTAEALRTIQYNIGRRDIDDDYNKISIVDGAVSQEDADKLLAKYNAGTYTVPVNTTGLNAAGLKAVRDEQRIIDDRALVEKNRQGLIKFGEIVAAGPQQTDWMNPVFTKEAEAMSLEGLEKGSDEYNRRLALQEKTGRKLAAVIDANYTDPRLRESRFGMYNRAMGAAGVVTPEMLAMVQQAGEAEELARESKLTSLKSQQSKLSEDTDKTQLDAAKTMFVESGKAGRKGSGSGTGKSETEGSGSLKQDTYDKALEVAMGQYKADYAPKWLSTDATNLETLNQYAAANKINPDKMFALLRSKTSAGSDKNDISEEDVKNVLTELKQNPSAYAFKSTKQGTGSTGAIDRNTALAGNAYQNIVNQQIANDRVQQARITDEIRKANMSSEERRTEYARTLLAPIIAGNRVIEREIPVASVGADRVLPKSNMITRTTVPTKVVEQIKKPAKELKEDTVWNLPRLNVNGVTQVNKGDLPTVNELQPYQKDKKVDVNSLLSNVDTQAEIIKRLPAPAKEESYKIVKSTSLSTDKKIDKLVDLGLSPEQARRLVITAK